MKWPKALRMIRCDKDKGFEMGDSTMVVTDCVAYKNIEGQQIAELWEQLTQLAARNAALEALLREALSALDTYATNTTLRTDVSGYYAVLNSSWPELAKDTADKIREALK